ncbi:Pentatricopeptide repeat-containing protein [Dichanthelium oligosanthes]|uniref:Pentatricopeptide repeat-containing protein n=1 Tax=Dichanthelium oligosanthes TaxID=888268 RepID=A0A1E5WFZ4_9POAL|nr:Pentatricopeptide repeat-containing protein [Dichanthelium oligosanthes]
MPAVPASADTGSSSEFDSAIRSLKNNLQPERLARLIDSTSDSTLALRIFRWASRQRYNLGTVDTYSCMISKLTAVENRDDMDSLLGEMVRLRVPALEQALSELVQSLCSKSRFDEALLVIQHATSAKLKLSLSACNGMLHGLVKQGSGLRLFMLAYMKIIKSGVLPDVDTLNWLILALCESGRVDLALIQFDRMSKKRCSPNSHTFEVLIMALCSHNRADEAVELFYLMLQLRCTPDSSFYAQVMPLFCKFSKVTEVIKVHQMMKEDGLQLDVHLYSALIRCLCENQLLDDAIMILNEMIVSGHAPMVSAYVDIVNCYWASAKFHKALSFLEENDVTESEPYNVLLRWLCINSRLQDSVGYLQKLHNRGLADSESWNIAVTHFCNEGNIRRASELIGRMVVSSFAPNDSTYSAIISCYCRLGLCIDALGMFRRVRVSNLSLNSESFSQLVEILCHTKRIQEAIEVFKYHCKKGCSTTNKSLDMLIQGSCLSGRIHEAVQLRSLAVCTGTSCTFFTYDIIIQALLHLKKEKDVLVLFAQMVMEGCLLDGYAYNSLLHSFLNKETIFEAAILFNRMVNHAFVPDQETFELLVNDMALFSFLNMVAQSLLKVVNTSGTVSPRIYNIIIYGLIKEGFKNEACKFLDQMLEKGWVPDSRTHQVLVGNIGGEEAREGDQVYQTVDDDNVSNILLEGLH